MMLQEGGFDTTSASVPTFREGLRAWARIGLMSFGGPAGQIALMHKVLVEEKRWIDEPRFLTALNFGMLVPGPEGMQLATYVGWRLHGLRGGLAAGLLFVLPGALIVLGLSVFYAAFGKMPPVEALFLGIKAGVLAIIVEALWRVASRALKQRSDWLIAAAAFVGLYLLALPYPLIVVMAGLFGYLRSTPPSSVGSAGPMVEIPPGRTIATAALWLAIWIVPLALVVSAFGSNHVLSELGWFFSKLAVVTFGGDYAVLAYVAQDAVEHYRWLTPPEMLDGLGLAEATPGPLTLVNPFVGYLAAYRHAAMPGLAPWIPGVLGAVVTLWATFAPCFLWVFTGAPYIERLNADPRLQSALSAITAAVVGVILNLSIWFTCNVLFARVDVVFAGPVTFSVPHLESVRWQILLLTAIAAATLFALRRGVVLTLAVCAAAAVGLHTLGLT